MKIKFDWRKTTDKEKKEFLIGLVIVLIVLLIWKW